MNSLEQLLQFVSRLQNKNIHFNLECNRDAIMVTVVSPSTYHEVEFFADGHIEAQTWGPPSAVRTVSLEEITDLVVRDVEG